MESLQKLKDYANIKDDWYLRSLIGQLELRKSEDNANELSKDDFAINFALWLSENSYENMYQDLDEDGATWVSYLHEGFDIRSTATLFTIEELLELYKEEL